MRPAAWLALFTIILAWPRSGVKPADGIEDALSPWQTDFALAKLLARRENKPILVVFR